MQSVSSSIWTRVAVNMSYDDNHYTTGTFLLFIKDYYFVLEAIESVQTNDNYSINLHSWNHDIGYRLLICDRNT